MTGFPVRGRVRSTGECGSYECRKTFLVQCQFNKFRPNIFPYFPHKCMFHYKDHLLSQDTAELQRLRRLFCGLIKWKSHELDLRFKGITELWA
ncbi:hypothetical protein SRHO_G00295590 [Serrasalmus rhombeus]